MGLKKQKSRTAIAVMAFIISRRYRMVSCFSSNPALGTKADYFLIVCFFVSNPQENQGISNKKSF